MKKAGVIVAGFLLLGMLIGCSSSSEEPQTQTTVSQTEDNTRETEEEKEPVKSEAAGNLDSSEETAEAATTMAETTAFIPDFKDKTLALECQDIIELPDTLGHISFSSSQPDVVSVDEHGTLTALAVGTADITVQINEEPYIFEVVVTTPEISDTSITKIAGNTTQLFFYGTTGEPVFKSDNPAIASVDKNGVVTAEFTGSGQSTKIHATVDGKEFIVDVTVEPIPQLLSTYEITLHQDISNSPDGKYQYEDMNLSLTGNANEIMHVEHEESGVYHCTFETVLNVADGDYSSGNDYPLYRTYYTGTYETSYARIYLAGSSQEAAVMIKYPNGAECQSQINYTPCDGYGMIDIQVHDVISSSGVIATVLIDGYTYTFAVGSLPVFRYEPGFETKLDTNYIVKECSVGDTIVCQSGSSSGIRSNSKTFYGSSFIYEIADKVYEAVENEAINYVVGSIFKLIF